jgi:hypothetical protein
MQKTSAPPDLLFKLLKVEIEKARREREYTSDPPRQLGTPFALHTEDRQTTPAGHKALSSTRTMNPLLLFLSLWYDSHGPQKS